MSHDQMGLGGSESGFVRTVKHLVELGDVVHVFNLTSVPHVKYGPQLEWSHIDRFDPKEPYDVVYSLRHREPFKVEGHVNASVRVLFMADTESHGLGDDVKNGNINLVMFVSHWQKEKIAKEEGLPDEYCMVTSNGVDSRPMPDFSQKFKGRCLFTATPERGLENLLTVWPRIKERVPWASLHLYSSYIAWGTELEENDKMLRDLYGRADELRGLDVVNWRHAPFETIRRAQQEADVYLYPSDFYETRCMSVLEAMYNGAIPVVTGRAALLEAVVPNVTGYVVPSYGASAKRYQDIFVDKAVAALRRSRDGISAFDHYRQNAMAYAARFTYDVLVEEWVAEWQSRLP